MRSEGPDRCGIILGCDPSHVGVARNWAYRNARSPRHDAFPLVLAVSLLVTNAQQHSRSGDPGGTVRVGLHRKPHTYTLTVTDNGPRPGQPILFPRPRKPVEPLATTGNGLLMLEELSVYWDWTGNAGEGLTVRALIDRAGHQRGPVFSLLPPEGRRRFTSHPPVRSGLDRTTGR
ncbi:ATP-binding protein [Nocardiopsis halotolerans]|uniref:ATP-binding protein n=1 Tax=Nocardiopsis halotolerans TaxID=124252 RepID=UPI0003664665|nr:ATP-binding protein [Nocardiopsis halotolerans]